MNEGLRSPRVTLGKGNTALRRLNKLHLLAQAIRRVRDGIGRPFEKASFSATCRLRPPTFARRETLEPLNVSPATRILQSSWTSQA
jgi:hypothetical protein